MGNDFVFLARQKRITIDGEDYYIDWLFYHRKIQLEQRKNVEYNNK